MTDEKILQVLKETETFVERELKELYDFIPEDKVSPDTVREGFVDYPEMVEKYFEIKQQKKKLLTFVKAEIKEIEGRK